MRSGTDPSPEATSPPAWAELDAAAKRERLLTAAAGVFTDHGLDAPMPAVARAAGAGVGSLYRQFPSKEELVAALAERRLVALEAELRSALRQPAAWAALEAFVWRVLGEDASDDVAAQAVATAGTLSPVRQARERVWALLDRLVDRAREQGDVRADASRRDVTMTIAAARAVRRLGPDDWRRMVQLALDGLRARG
ncbi:MAG TPA: TetR family transcriptional regulator [Baekduia sp.]|nr:TetR family transcriptional regulator [Baekduia sp.]